MSVHRASNLPHIEVNTLDHLARDPLFQSGFELKKRSRFSVKLHGVKEALFPLHTFHFFSHSSPLVVTLRMDLIAQGYGSSSDSEDSSSRKPAKVAKITSTSLQVNGAPDVSLEVSYPLFTFTRSAAVTCALFLSPSTVVTNTYYFFILQRNRTQHTRATSIPTLQTQHSPSTSTTIRCSNQSKDQSTPLRPKPRRSAGTSGRAMSRKTCFRNTTSGHSNSPMLRLDTQKTPVS